MSRLTRKTLEGLSTDQRDLFDKIVASRPVKPNDGHIGGPFDAWLQNPDLGRRLVGLGSFFRFDTSVDCRYIELAILVTGQYWQAQFEWYAHEPMAREAGVPNVVIEAIKIGEQPPMDDPKDRAVYELATQLHNTRKLSADAYDSAVGAFGEQGVAELVGLCGFYTMVSMTLNTFDVPLPEGAEYPFIRT